MKKGLFIIALLLVLVGCKAAKVYEYDSSNIDDFNKVLEEVGNVKTKAYDLRHQGECEAGRIPGFFCMRTINSDDEVKSLDDIYSNLLLTTSRDKSYLIILIDEDGEDSKYLSNLLFEEGYYNVHYFTLGYESYKELMGDDFTPEVGECEC